MSDGFNLKNINKNKIAGQAIEKAAQFRQSMIANLKVFLVLVVILIIGLVGGVAATLGTARLTSAPVLFLLAGLLGFLVIYGLGAWLITSRIKGKHSRFAMRNVAIFGAMVVFLVLVKALLVHLPYQQEEAQAVPAQQYWDLSTGSHIAYVALPAVGVVKDTPVIFVHGGPGMPDMAGDAQFLQGLTGQGFTVYIYDQAGAGRSSRLSKPSDYTLERDVSDLEEIRQEIGADDVILIGHSYGGKVVAAYGAQYGDHVAKAVLLSPSSLSAGTDNILADLTMMEKLNLAGDFMNARVLLTYGLLQVNPQAAHAYAGDKEMDAWLDHAYVTIEKELHCPELKVSTEPKGLGFYASQTARLTDTQDWMSKLSGQKIPALIIKGSCDYLPWSSAVEYRQALDGAELVYLKQAGHNIYQDQPNKTMALLKAFLSDRQLPEPIYSDTKVPADYKGPKS